MSNALCTEFNMFEKLSIELVMYLLQIHSEHLVRSYIFGKKKKNQRE